MDTTEFLMYTMKLQMDIMTNPDDEFRIVLFVTDDN